MAILKGFPPSNQIGPSWAKVESKRLSEPEHYCRPMTDEEEVIYGEYLWKTRHAVVKWKEIHPGKDR